MRLSDVLFKNQWAISFTRNRLVKFNNDTEFKNKNKSWLAYGFNIDFIIV